MRSFNRKAVTFAAAATLVLGGGVTAYAMTSSSEGKAPASCERPANPSLTRGGAAAPAAQYPKNSKGQTYGGASPDGVGMPDLVQAMSQDGKPGYVSACDLYADDSTQTIPMYDKEGNPNGKSFKVGGERSEGGVGTIGDKNGPQLK